jgi:hypothetical protein
MIIGIQVFVVIPGRVEDANPKSRATTISRFRVRSPKGSRRGMTALSAWQSVLVISEDRVWRPVIRDSHFTPAASDFSHVLQ